MLQAEEARGTFTAIYSAKVRITVRTADRGHRPRRPWHWRRHRAPSAGEVQDRALKAAETDATKRALATFGKAFGLALYAGDRRPASGAGNAAARAVQTGLASLTASNPVQENTVASAPAAATSPTDEVGDEDPAATRLTATSRIQKNLLTFSEPERVRDKGHLHYVSAQPCLLCSATPSDPHHLRFAQPRAMARKVGDDFTVPLCRKHHRDLHDSGNEAAWWHDMGIEPLEIARQLWDEGQKNQRFCANLDLDGHEPKIKTVPDTASVDQGG